MPSPTVDPEKTPPRSEREGLPRDRPWMCLLSEGFLNPFSSSLLMQEKLLSKKPRILLSVWPLK
jgi:hypothetical protein